MKGIETKYNQAEQYFDTIASNYDNISSNSVHLAENKIVLSILSQLIGERRYQIQKILDLGCGTGLGYEMTEAVLGSGEKVRYEGIDISSQMLKRCIEKYNLQHRQNVILRKEDFNEINISLLGEADLIMMTFGSFSYVEKPQIFLQTLSEMLTHDNGHVLLMAYSRFSMRNQMMALKSGNPIYTSKRRPYAFRNDESRGYKAIATFYTAEELTEMANSAGLKSIKIHGKNFNSVTETECNTVEDAEKLLRVEMESAINPNDAHALILTARNY